MVNLFRLPDGTIINADRIVLVMKSGLTNYALFLGGLPAPVEIDHNQYEGLKALCTPALAVTT